MSDELSDFDRGMLRRWPLSCHEDVTRDGQSEPCDRPAVAARFDPNEGGAYPVCVKHTRHHMVPLAQLLGVVVQVGADTTEGDA